MEYRGKFEIFNTQDIKTYPLKIRPNKVTKKNLINLAKLKQSSCKFESEDLKEIASFIVNYCKKNKPVILFTGAHLIKNGLSPIIIDLIKKKFITHYATTGAGVIHDFELALIGETSENVPDALPQGRFGMAQETAGYINDALNKGNSLKLGFGESIAKMILGEAFPYKVKFLYPELSIIASAYKSGIPATVHVGIGTDIIDQHPNFSGEAKGGTSGRDFLIYTKTIEKLTQGGIILNIGSAITGPEVLLKAVSMVANVGKIPYQIITANFDFRSIVQKDIDDENKPTYYFRDNKSIVIRIPKSFNGKGYYIQGNQQDTIPALYQLIIRKIKKEKKI